MRHRTIPQRELRNDIAAILREAEAGTEFTVTVRGRAVARLGPMEEADAPKPRRDVDRETLRRFFERNPPDEAWAAELAETRAEQPPIDDPWNDG
jgi:prevent-host-death family protein